ncbi:hypothetical protein [Hyphobacterium sp.]|uniref:hypothetical protein n=1 Tax=Hyphobacterium sp. TaxID=2004662 RepID=UPI003747DB66
MFVLRFVAFACLTTTLFSSPVLAQVVLRSSVLPNSRAATVNQATTVFATMLNSGDSELANCSVSLAGSDPYTFSYQRTDAANAPVGTADTPFSIPANTAQSLLLAFTPSQAAPGTEVQLTYRCDEATASIIPGVNTVFLTASDTATPDIIPILATPSSDGVLRFDTQGQVRAMSAAAINIGEAADIDVSAQAPFLPNNVSLQVCETNPVNGTCLTARASSVRVNFARNQTRTFAVFADAADNAGIPNLPAVSRLYLVFNGVPAPERDVDTASALFPATPPVYGATSSAAIAPGPGGDEVLGIYRGILNGEPGVLLVHGFNQVIMGGGGTLIDGISSGVGFPNAGSYSATTTGIGDSEYLPRVGIGSTSATYQSRSFFRGSYRHISGSPIYDFQAAWDPESLNVFYADDTPVGSWSIMYESASIGTVTVDAGGNIDGAITWPAADGAAAEQCDVAGITGGGGRAGFNLGTFIVNADGCGPSFYFHGYYADRGNQRVMAGYAVKQASRSGTLDMFPVELIRQ